MINFWGSILDVIFMMLILIPVMGIKNLPINRTVLVAIIWLIAGFVSYIFSELNGGGVHANPPMWIAIALFGGCPIFSFLTYLLGDKFHLITNSLGRWVIVVCYSILFSSGSLILGFFSAVFIFKL